MIYCVSIGELSHSAAVTIAKTHEINYCDQSGNSEYFHGLEPDYWNSGDEPEEGFYAPFFEIRTGEFLQNCLKFDYIDARARYDDASKKKTRNEVIEKMRHIARLHDKVIPDKEMTPPLESDVVDSCVTYDNVYAYLRALQVEQANATEQDALLEESVIVLDPQIPLKSAYNGCDLPLHKTILMPATYSLSALQAAKVSNKIKRKPPGYIADLHQKTFLCLTITSDCS